MTLALSGCGSQLVDYRPRPIEQYRHFQVQDGLAVAVEPLTDGAEAERYFGSDLVSTGRLAVLVIVENRGSTSVLVSTDKIALGGTQAGATPKGPDQTKAVVTGVTSGTLAALFVTPVVVPLLLFLPVASAMIANSNEMKHNFQAKELRTKTLSPGENTKGFMYFHLPPKGAEQTQWSVGLEVMDLSRKEPRRFVFPFDWERKK